MSDPTYRIDVEPDPHTSSAPWYVKIYSLADETFAKAAAHHRTTEEGLDWARAWIARETQRAQGFAVYVDDDGQPVEGHSVKAS